MEFSRGGSENYSCDSLPLALMAYPGRGKLTIRTSRADVKLLEIFPALVGRIAAAPSQNIKAKILASVSISYFSYLRTSHRCTLR